MKFSLTFKTPDVLDQLEDKNQRTSKLIKKFIQDGEYVTITLCDETGTATVEPIKKRRAW